LSVTSEVKLKAAVPPGSRFRGCEDVLVQDLQISVAVTRYRRERWETATGERIVAPLSPGILGGFGPERRRFIAAGDFQGQVTSERLTALLNGIGLKISKRQVVRLLSKGMEALAAEDQAVLRTGLETARWISVDDTSARRAGKDGFVTRVGDRRFTVFRTAMSKSRRAFLSLLQAGRTDYVVNDAALARMRTMNMAAAQVAALANHAETRFGDEAASHVHLHRLGFDTLKITLDPVKVATEAALWGATCDKDLLRDTVIVSDGAGQFRVGDHALCWVHADQLVHKLQPLCAAHRRSLAQPDLVVLCRPEGLSARPRSKARPELGDALWPDLHQPNRLGHGRPAVGPPAQDQTRPATRSGPTRDPASQQRFRKRQPHRRNQAQNLRRYRQRGRQDRPRYHARPAQDLQQARHLLLPVAR